MKQKVSFISICFLFLSLFFSSCYKEASSRHRVYLDKNWQYSIQGQPYPFYDIKLNDLQNLSQFLDTRIGYVFIKTTFTIPQELKHKELSLNLGRIKIASKIYVNNHTIGKTGTFPPYEFTEGNKSYSFRIPKEYLIFDGENTLMICLWCHGYGEIQSLPFISDSIDSEMKAGYDSLVYSKIYLIFTVILFIISLIYFFLFLLRRSEIENFSFSLLCLFTGIYLSIFYFGEYSFLRFSFLTYLYFEKIFKGTSALMTGYMIICFTRDFMHYPESWRSRLIRFFITLTGAIIPLTASNIPDFRFRLRIGFLFIIIQYGFFGKVIYAAYKKKDKKLNHYILCLIPFIIAFSSQLIAKIFFKQNIDTLLLAISWVAVIFFFLGILIIHFVRLANEVEFMNKNLESLVTERTEALEKEKNRALKEIDLAGFVQRNFYKVDTSEISDWDIKITSKAMAGVSGDLYILFTTNNHLDGIGIFDISGHGIASGLVTMLVKNIIEREFKKGKELPLSEVMTKINERIITEKGNIENYLTGMLLRFGEKEIELVNAGHPKALLYKAKTGLLRPVEKEGINQFGAIGIPDFLINFELLTFSMEKDDELVLYTDGITECSNSDKKYFGIEGIISVFMENVKKDVDKQVEALPSAILDFTGTENLNDDITYIILKKK